MGRILAIDPGTKRCGVAVSDSGRTMAFPRPAIEAGERFAAQLRALVDEESCDLVVVGRPVALSGASTPSTQLADQLFEELVAALAPVAVVQCDERLTTAQAGRSLSSAGLKVKQHRERIDSAAAVVLLQHYLDAQRDA
jgi:putative holliday junction resolvase